VGVASSDPLCALFQDYDWADEVLHAAIGRQWYVKEFASAKEAAKHGEEAWATLRGDGDHLSDHRNWWPEVYTQACQFWNIAPDPRVLNYDVRYAREKHVSASG